MEKLMKYSFGFSRDAAVECPEMDAFMTDLIAVCERHGIGFELDVYSEGGDYLVPTPFSQGDFAIFYDHMSAYRGGIPWLDAAKTRYDIRRGEQSQEYQRQQAIENEQRDRAEFERLKQKYQDR